mmetsp:Transcript_12041/g.33861  ORF Transcript_12041/g.33861 Transcript_12041/m.33861 type:complete len:1014 (+) Transcript_12041:259-3300(+)
MARGDMNPIGALLLLCLVIQSATRSSCELETTTGIGLVVAPSRANGRYPYLASLRHPDTLEHYCSGSVASPLVIITAAQCVDSRLGGHPKPVVYVGLECAECDTTGNNFEVQRTDKNLVQRQWTGQTSDGGDLAILFLEEPLSSAFVRVLPQPDISSFTDATELWIAGWGRQAQGPESDQPGPLQQVPLQYINPPSCNTTYTLTGSDLAPITSQQICARGPPGNDCIVDVGGPLILRGDGWESDILLGVASFGSMNCNDPLSLPAVFTALKPLEVVLANYLPRSGPIPGLTTDPEGYCSFSGCPGGGPPSASDAEGWCHLGVQNCDVCNGQFCLTKDTTSPIKPSVPQPTCTGPSYRRLAKWELDKLEGGAPGNVCSRLCDEDELCVAAVYNNDVYYKCKLYSSCVEAAGSPTDVLWLKPAQVSAQSSATYACTERPREALALWQLAKIGKQPGTVCKDECSNRPDCKASVYNGNLYYKCKLYSECTVKWGNAGDRLVLKNGQPAAVPTNCLGVPYSILRKAELFRPNARGCQAKCENDSGCAASVFSMDGFLNCKLYDTCTEVEGPLYDVLFRKAAHAMMGSTPVSTPRPVSVCHGEPSHSYSGNTLSRYGAVASEACEWLCSEDDSCVASVFNEWEYFACRLFTECEGRVPGSLDDVLWLKSNAEPTPAPTVPPGPTCEERPFKKLALWELRKFDAPPQDTCESECRNDQQCVAAVYNVLIYYRCKLFSVCSEVYGERGDELVVRRPPGPEESVIYPYPTCKGTLLESLQKWQLANYGSYPKPACRAVCEKRPQCVASVFNPTLLDSCRLFSECEEAPGAADDILAFKPIRPTFGEMSTDLKDGDLVAAATCRQGSSRVETKYNLNVKYNDLRLGCRTECERWQDCAAYVFDDKESDNACSLYSSCSPRPGPANVFLGVVREHNVRDRAGISVDTRMGRRCSGDEMLQYNVASSTKSSDRDGQLVGACEQLCWDDVECKAFVFTPGARWDCQLYKDCDEQDGSDTQILGML